MISVVHGNWEHPKLLYPNQLWQLRLTHDRWNPEPVIVIPMERFCGLYTQNQVAVSIYQYHQMPRKRCYDVSSCINQRPHCQVLRYGGFWRLSRRQVVSEVRCWNTLPETIMEVEQFGPWKTNCPLQGGSAQLPWLFEGGYCLKNHPHPSTLWPSLEKKTPAEFRSRFLRVGTHWKSN